MCEQMLAMDRFGNRHKLPARVFHVVFASGPGGVRLGGVHVREVAHWVLGLDLLKLLVQKGGVSHLLPPVHSDLAGRPGAHAGHKTECGLNEGVILDGSGKHFY